MASSDRQPSPPSIYPPTRRSCSVFHHICRENQCRKVTECCKVSIIGVGQCQIGYFEHSSKCTWWYSATEWL